MIKKIIFTVGIFVFSGCFSSNQTATATFIENIQNVNSIKCEISSYKRVNKFNYIYEFINLKNGKRFIANSDRYYYNSGDLVFLSVLNGKITNMNLVNRKNNGNVNFNSEKVAKNGVKISKIAVPQPESINLR